MQETKKNADDCVPGFLPSLCSSREERVVILFSLRPRKRPIRSGYLFCPNCRRRTPGEMFVMTSRFYLLGFIPTGSVSESKNFLGCGQCGESFDEDGDWAFDFGDHAEPLLWD